MLHGPAQSYILSLSCVSMHSVNSLRALLHLRRPSTQSGRLSAMLAGHSGWWYLSVWSIDHRKMILVWHCCSAGPHRCWVSLIFSILFSIILSDIFTILPSLFSTVSSFFFIELFCAFLQKSPSPLKFPPRFSFFFPPPVSFPSTHMHARTCARTYPFKFSPFF